MWRYWSFKFRILTGICKWSSWHLVTGWTGFRHSFGLQLTFWHSLIEEKVKHLPWFTKQKHNKKVYLILGCWQWISYMFGYNLQEYLSSACHHDPAHRHPHVSTHVRVCTCTHTQNGSKWSTAFLNVVQSGPPLSTEHTPQHPSKCSAWLFVKKSCPTLNMAIGTHLLTSCEVTQHNRPLVPGAPRTPRSASAQVLYIE